MNKPDINQQVITIIANCLGLEVADININSHLVNDLGADSVDAVNLQWELQETLGVQLDETHFSAIQTVKDLIDVCQQQLP